MKKLDALMKSLNWNNFLNVFYISCCPFVSRQYSRKKERLQWLKTEQLHFIGIPKIILKPKITIVFLLNNIIHNFLYKFCSNSCVNSSTLQSCDAYLKNIINMDSWFINNNGTVYSGFTFRFYGFRISWFINNNGTLYHSGTNIWAVDTITQEFKS